MKLNLDWSAYESAGMGDAYADIPKTGGDFAKAVAVCIGSRQCELSGKGVMCPSYRVTGDSRLSTGGRVKLLKAALNGELGAKPFLNGELAEAMELCVSCKGCKRECENAVDMALIKAEYLAQRFNAAGMPLRNRLWANLPRLLRYRTAARLLAVAWNRYVWFARCGELLLGIAAKAKLPLPALRPFGIPSSQAQCQEPNGEASAPGREVVLFVDTFNRHFKPEVAEAALSVLTAAGYKTYLAEPAPHAGDAQRPLCCGRTYFSNGMIEQARGEARRLLHALKPHLQAGRWVVGLEPSCILSLRDEYLTLGLGDEARQLAEKTLLLEEFIAREETGKRWQLAFQALPDQRRWLVHGHCHQKAVGAMKAMRKVLKMVPELDAAQIEASCCGMAGHFGLEAEHYAVSQDMAQQALFPALNAEPQAAVLANGFSCRQQIVNGGYDQPLHLAQLLQAALPGGEAAQL